MTARSQIGGRPPDDLIERDQWVLWRHENGSKVPYRIGGQRASTTNTSHWSEYGAAIQALAGHPKSYSGIGFVFSEADPFVGIDLDDCLEDTTGNPKPCIQPMLERFADTYMEVSPSGRGVKIWSRGKAPAAAKIALDDGCALELYDRARYFTVTARVFRNAPLEIEDHAHDVIALFHRLVGRRTEYSEVPRYHIPLEGKIPHGMQHLTLVSLAGTLRRRGVCDEAIEACLQAVNRHQCELPGPEKNISRIVHSSRGWGRM